MTVELVGEPSDAVEAITATGTGGITSVFVSMAERHPDGRDAAYLAWHTLDHRPEQHRLMEVRASLRLVSTPACRAARAASDAPFDAIDHVMTYFFTDPGLDGFERLSDGLRDAGRTPYVLPAVHRDFFDVRDKRADPSGKVGADVLPWWPSRGVYLVLGERPVSPTELVGIDGVAGAWSTVAHADAALHLTLAFLDDDPVAVATRVRAELAPRWHADGRLPRLAAPFELVVPWDWSRHLP